jgi:hypothetical protein
MLVITGLITVNVRFERLGIEFTVTVTGPGPVTALLGTRATICVLFQLVIEVATPPLNPIVLVPWVVPKLDPVTVTDVPTDPTVGDRPVTKGVVPKVIDTLSKVAVASFVLSWLLTPRPMYAFCAMVIVWLVPI